MTDLVERLRAQDWWRGEYGSKEILCHEAADEIDRLRKIETLYTASQGQWLQAEVSLRDAEIERLRAAIDAWATARKAMMADSAEGKPWSSESIAVLGLAEAALMQVRSG